MFTKKTIRDIDLNGKTVLMRADYNVPVEKGMITDDYRIEQSLPTVKYLLGKNVKLIICSHLGRPGGRINPEESLLPVAKRLDELLGGGKVTFVRDCIGPEVAKEVKALEPGHVLLLENVRFHPEEEANDKGFAKALATLADVFVQDAFGVAHHPAVTVSELPKYMPGAAGLLLEKEVDTITQVMEKPKRPLMAVIGGAKISDKIDVLHRFIELADVVAVGGAMANTFLAAEGVDVAKSLIEQDDFGIARDILAKAKERAGKEHFVFALPFDGVVADKVDRLAPTRIVDWNTHVIASIESYPKRPAHDDSQIKPGEMILDIGPFTGSFYAGAMQLTNTVIWNGAMGVTEQAGMQGPVGPYAHGTELVMEAMLGQFGHRPYSLVGGGDTVAFVEQRGLVKAFDHVSTGGGASLELMAGRKLPGVEALQDKGDVQ